MATRDNLLDILYHASARLSSCSTIDSLQRSVRELMKMFPGLPQYRFFFYNKETKSLISTLWNPKPKGKKEMLAATLTHAATLVYQRKRKLYIPDTLHNKEITVSGGTESPIGSIIGLPIVSQNEFIGAAVFCSP